jgi:uncharacterized protein
MNQKTNDIQMREPTKEYMNPYLAGFLLGVLIIATVFITGRGLGASGAVKDLVVAAGANLAPEKFTTSAFFGDYFSSGGSPKRSWLVIQTLGLLLGAFLSGFLARRGSFKIEKGPGIRNLSRLSFALAGGALFGIGAQLGRGCTSGTALSGMAVFSTAGFLTMMAIFGTGYLVAWFFKKLWI